MLPIDKKQVQQVATPKGGHSPSSSSSNGEEPPRKVQSAARAAKRQRGRERRKLYRAQAHELKCIEAARERQEEEFAERQAALAAEMKLVVKNTFYDVDDSEEDCSQEVEIHLPPAIFNSTGEIDEWRKDYRRFRLGHHHGAKGEVNQELLMDSLAALDLSKLKPRPTAALPA